MNLFRTSVLAGCVLAALQLEAAPLQRADLPANPAWAAHLDCDGLRASSLGALLNEHLARPEVQARLAIFQSLFGFDPTKQLHGLTVYGTGLKLDQGVLIVYADFQPDKLAALARAANGYTSTDHNGYAISSWVDENKKGKDGGKARVYAAIRGQRVIFSSQEAAVAAALDVLDGGPNLSTSGNLPELGASGSTDFIQAAVQRLDIPDHIPHAAILRLAKVARLGVGESQGTLSVTSTLEGKDADVAKNMMDIAQGLVALGKLDTEKPLAGRLANAVTLKLDGATFTSTLALPSSDVVQMIKAAAQHHHKHSPN